MFKTYINGTSLSYVQYLSNMWLPSVSPIIPDGKTKAPAEEKSNFMISIHIGQLKYVLDVSRSLNLL